MFKSIQKIFLVAAIALAPAALHAQSDFDQSEVRKGKKNKKGQKGKMLRGMGKALKEAGVDETTRQAIKADLKNHKPAMKALRTQMKEARTSGDPLLIGEARLRMQEKRLEMMSDVRKHLTDSQWNTVTAKLKENRKAKKAKRKGKRKAKRDNNNL